MAVGNLTGYLQDAALKHILNKAVFAVPVNLYLGLYTTAPTKTTPGVEVAGAGYSPTRPVIAFNAISNGSTTNSNLITFGPAGAGGWDQVVALAVLDSNAVGGSANQLFFGSLVTPRTIPSGDSIQFAPDSITITLG